MLRKLVLPNLYSFDKMEMTYIMDLTQNVEENKQSTTCDNGSLNRDLEVTEKQTE